MNVFGAVPEAIVLRFGWTLIHSLWEGMGIAAMAAMLLRAMSQASAHARYLTACALMGLLPLTVLATYAVLGTQERPMVTAEAPVHELPAPSAQRILPQQPIQDAPRSDIQPASILHWLVGFWLLGVAVVASRHALGWLLLCRWNRGRPMSELESVVPPLARRLRISRNVRLIESLRFDVPAVVGVFRPIILLPVGILCDLTPGQVELILVHELAHIARHDYLVNLLQAVIESLMFYHPATWWLSAQIRREREHCCDDIATSHCSNPGEYARALLALEHRRAPAMSPATAATGGDLAQRVRRLLRAGDQPRRRPLRSIGAALLAIISVAIVLAVVARKTLASPPIAATSPTTAAASQLAIDSPILPEDLQPNTAPYRIGANDLVQVSVTGEGAKEWTATVRAGALFLAKLGPDVLIKLAGMTKAEAQKEIIDAYEKAGIKGVRADVEVMEARGSTFTAMGAFARPGEYAIWPGDLRLSGALKMAGARSSEIGDLRVVRAVAKSQASRILSINIAKLVAGDAAQDVVIRSGDLVYAQYQPHLFRVEVGRDMLLYHDTPTEIPWLKKGLEQVPASERKATVLEVAAAAPDVTVERFFAAKRDLAPLVTEFGLAKMTEVPLDPATASVPMRPPMQVGEYYIGGYVQRPGAYSLTAREVTLKQAIIAAGSLDPGLTNAFLSVERKESGRAFPLLRNASFQDLLSGKQPDVILRPNDEVMVSPSPIVESDATGGVSAPAPRWDHSDDPAMINLDMAIQHYEELRLRHDDAEIAKGADNPDVVILAKQEQKAYEVYLDAQQRATESHLNQQQNQGVYYIGGHVQRPGVYAVPGREITLKQAIIAAGSLDPDVDNDFLSVERRENGRVVSVLKNARYQDLLSGKQPDVSLHPNDTVVISKNPIKENGPTDGVPSTQK